MDNIDLWTRKDITEKVKTLMLIVADMDQTEFGTAVTKTVTIKDATNTPLAKIKILSGFSAGGCGLVETDENGVCVLPVLPDTLPSTVVKVDTIGYNEASLDLGNGDPVDLVLVQSS